MAPKLTQGQKKHMAGVIKQIAAKNHTTVSEVRRSLEELIADAMANPDPVIRARWANCPSDGEVPTPEDFLFWTAEMVEKGL